MKNLLIYISPTGSFDNERPDLINDAALVIKAQIDSINHLGWKKEDVLLYTNFDYEYGGVKATVLKGVDFFERKPQVTKINAIIKLFEDGLIREGELYWFHDIDAYQIRPITESELGVGAADMALTDCGRLNRWSAGCIFFKSGAKDIFYRIKEVCYEKNIDEEESLGLLTKNDPDIGSRVKEIDRIYNFTAFHIRSFDRAGQKPLDIRVAHFHPLAGIRRLGIKRSFHFFAGENKLGEPLITAGLIKIFNNHGIK
jgi:hypothetical protein